MIRLGMIGAESYHAIKFAKIANIFKNHWDQTIPVQVDMIWGESEQQVKRVAQQAQIPHVAAHPEDMIGHVDGVMIVLRRGDSHMDAAMPFLQRGIPVWVDKPFAHDVQNAVQMIQQAQKTGGILMGGSICPLCDDVCDLKKKVQTLRKNGTLRSAMLNFPAQVDSPYGGLSFYGIHGIQIVLETFGESPCCIRTDQHTGSLTATFDYADVSVLLNFAQTPDTYGILLASQETIVHPIRPEDGYQKALCNFVQAIRNGNGTDPQYLLPPILALNAVEESLRTGMRIKL